MPNHVINRLIFDCPEERLTHILSEICYDDSAEVETTGIGTIDYNKIAPTGSPWCETSKRRKV